MKGKIRQIRPSQVIRLLEELRGIRNNLKQLIAVGDELNRLMEKALPPYPAPDVQDDDDQETDVD